MDIAVHDVFIAGIWHCTEKSGVLKEESRMLITDLVLYGFLPCNIINSFRMEFNFEILKKFALVLVISLLVQVVSYTLSRILYNQKPEAVKRVLQYCTLVSNSGFLGLPIAESIYGAKGVMYASVFIIPMRVMMWSVGISCFTESPDMKTVFKRIATHSCIIAVYIGLGLMFFQVSLSLACEWVTVAAGPAGVAVEMLVQALDKAVRSAGGCTTTTTMILIGTMLADVSSRDMLQKDTVLISGVRLGFLPLLVMIGCRIAGINPFLAGVCTDDWYAGWK